MTSFAINLKGNTKTQVPTTTSHKNSCPDTCPLKEKGCYAKHHFLGKYWNRLTDGEVKNSFDYDTLLRQIKALPKGQLWRHNQAGDLLHDSGTICKDSLEKLVKANSKRSGFTYTHHVLNRANLVALNEANKKGFTINASTDNVSQADQVFKVKGLPVVTLLPLGADNVTYTPKGHKVVACPAEKSKKVTCSNCALCADKDRDYIIGFRAHGTAKKAVNDIALINIQ